jgi:hypothetical protein
MRRLAMMAAVLAGMSGFAGAQSGDMMSPMAPTGSMSAGHGGHMGAHMMLSAPRPLKPGDKEKADAVAAAAKAAIEPYKDYKKALADGFQIFMPELPQKMYHFTNYERGVEAAQYFDPSKPTSLLYEKTSDGGYKLIGAMYTDRQRATEWELNERIPLSIARWHQHTNFCRAPQGHQAEYFGKDAKYGLLGSISTREACEAAGGQFIPTMFGWMVHVYPFEKDPKQVWSIDRDDDSDGNMTGMKM